MGGIYFFPSPPSQLELNLALFSIFGKDSIDA